MPYIPKRTWWMPENVNPHARYIFMLNPTRPGQVRSLIHNKCNIGLHYIEDEKFLMNAKAYIERHRLGG